MKRESIEERMETPKEMEVKIEGTSLTLKGPKGELTKDFFYPRLKLHSSNGFIIITTRGNTKREQKIIGTIKAHIRNMIKGITEGHRYEMKICSGHFPMHVSVSGNDFIVKNFFGERYPRKLKIRKGVNVGIEGSNIVLEGINKELVAQTAADIEQLTRRTKYDRRVFQDGIYVVNKDGKELK